MASPKSDGIVTKSTPSGRKSLYATSSPFEQQIGYYRAVRRGNQIFVAGTTSVDKNSPTSAPQIRYPGDAKNQTRVAFEESIKAIQALGGEGAQSVVRVKMFVARKDVCGVVGEAFREIFGKGKGDRELGTTATMIVVQNGFIDDDMLVEVEVDAVAEDD
jgi:enamine deaminase RidA (YjgF/YER057c/UK114 family)